MEYQALAERVGVVTGGVNIGVIHLDHDNVLLVDTGANESNARKLLRIVRDDLGLNICGILTTHAHADHVSGHAFVVKRTDARVYAPPIESTIVRYPFMQPSMLFGGAAPPAALRERFILAQPARVDEEIHVEALAFDEIAVSVISLPGHSPNQVGYLVDEVFFCADVVFPEAAIAKYRIPYLFDLDNHLASMEKAARVQADVIVPGHGPVESSFALLHEQNVAIVEETSHVILDHLEEAIPLDTIAARVFEAMNVPIIGHISYYLLRPTIAAYLTSLEGRGLVDHVLHKNQSCWVRS